jgi:poly(A) polymerase Pap1
MNEFPEINEGTSMTCSRAADIFARLKMSIPIVKADYQLLLQYIKTLANLRSGFYCTLCDADFQSQTNFYWESLSNKKFYLGSSFCTQFIKIALPFVKYISHNFRVYAESAAKLIQCKLNSKGISNDTERLKYIIPEANLTDYETCQDGVNKNQGLFSCSNFCEKFDLTTISPMIDGDMVQMKKFVTYFRKNRKYFGYPENNFLVGSIQDTETLLDLNDEVVRMSTVFFSSKIDADEMNKHNTGIHQSDGVDIFALSRGNKYPLFIESQSIMQVAAMMIITLCLIFGH